MKLQTLNKLLVVGIILGLIVLGVILGLQFCSPKLEKAERPTNSEETTPSPASKDPGERPESAPAAPAVPDRPEQGSPKPDAPAPDMPSSDIPEPDVSDPGPEPEPDPLPKPVAPPEALAKGSIRSDSGTSLNILAEWYLLPEDGKLQVNVSLSAYSIDVSARKNGMTLMIGDKKYTEDTDVIEYDGDELTTILLASFMVDAPASDCDISASWQFNGAYSGVELPVITAEGSIKV